MVAPEGRLINDLSFTVLAKEAIPLANKFYQDHGISNRAKGHDLVWVARDKHRMVGAARLTPVCNKYWLLTGVYVGEDYRGHGIASQLISQSLNLTPVVYTFALTHLNAYYRQLGFSDINFNDLPCELAQRFNAYAKQGRKIVAMIKQ